MLYIYVRTSSVAVGINQLNHLYIEYPYRKRSWSNNNRYMHTAWDRVTAHSHVHVAYSAATSYVLSCPSYGFFCWAYSRIFNEGSGADVVSNARRPRSKYKTSCCNPKQNNLPRVCAAKHWNMGDINTETSRVNKTQKKRTESRWLTTLSILCGNSQVTNTEVASCILVNVQGCN